MAKSMIVIGGQFFGNNQQGTISKQSAKKIYFINTCLISENLRIKIDL